MPFIALVYIPDDHTADAVVQDQVNVSSWGTGVRMVALHEFPDRMELSRGCKGCTPPGRKVVGWGRSKRGHIVCGGCGARNPKVRQWFTGALFDWFGANIYPNAPKVFRTPEGYENPPR